MNAVQPHAVTGGILAGGLSRRMNGLEKSLIELDGIPLIDRTISRLGPQAENIVINANGDLSRFEYLNCDIVADIVTGYSGPLAGIHSLLDFVARTSPHITHVASVAADTPFFPEDYVKKCIAELNESGSAIVLAMSNQNRHPVFGLWPVTLLGSLAEFLEKAETRKVMAFVKLHRHSFVDFSPGIGDEITLDPFFNVNEPQDLEIANS